MQKELTGLGLGIIIKQIACDSGDIISNLYSIAN